MTHTRGEQDHRINIHMQLKSKSYCILFDGDKQSLKLLNFVFDGSTWMQSTDKIVDKHRIKFI